MYFTAKRLIVAWSVLGLAPLQALSFYESFAQCAIFWQKLHDPLTEVQKKIIEEKRREIREYSRNARDCARRGKECLCKGAMDAWQEVVAVCKKSPSTCPNSSKELAQLLAQQPGILWAFSLLKKYQDLQSSIEKKWAEIHTLEQEMKDSYLESIARLKLEITELASQKEALEKQLANQPTTHHESVVVHQVHIK